jgi:hypothetical protein
MSALQLETVVSAGRATDRHPLDAAAAALPLALAVKTALEVISN